MRKIQKTAKNNPIRQRARHHAKLAVVPHAANGFHPHLIRWYGVVAMIILTFFALAASHAAEGGAVLGVKANVTATELLNDTNAEREKRNEGLLRYDEQLSSAAFLKAQDMFRQQYWAHTAPDGTTPWQWFAKAGYNYAYAGENLAKNFTTTDATVSAWMSSTHHRENILNPNYTDVGFAVVDGVLDGKQTTLIVALYGSPASGVAGATTTTGAAASGNMTVLSRIGIALQSMSPAVLGSVVLLLVGAFVAIAAHAYRNRMPVAWRKSWKYHHGAYKAIGLTSFAVVLVALYSGGQI